MKSIILVLLLSLLAGQNLQLHYELDQGRRYMVSTLEMFRPDDFGATYWFVDVQYDDSGTKSASLAYLELARYFKFPLGNKLQTTVQYNDGLFLGGGLGQVWLGGVSTYLNLPILPLTVDLLYRHQSGTVSNDIQITTVWSRTVFDGKISLMGFFDLWTFANAGNDGKDWIFLSEPQLWYHLTEQAALGGEIHIFYNFPVVSQAWEFYPTLGFKWEF